MSNAIEILVHISARYTAQDDARYRNQALAFFNFQPGRRHTISVAANDINPNPDQSVQQDDGTVPSGPASSASKDIDTLRLQGPNCFLDSVVDQALPRATDATAPRHPAEATPRPGERRIHTLLPQEARTRASPTVCVKRTPVLERAKSESAVMHTPKNSWETLSSEVSDSQPSVSSLKRLHEDIDPRTCPILDEHVPSPVAKRQRLGPGSSSPFITIGDQYRQVDRGPRLSSYTIDGDLSLPVPSALARRWPQAPVPFSLAGQVPSISWSSSSRPKALLADKPFSNAETKPNPPKRPAAHYFTTSTPPHPPIMELQVSETLGAAATAAAAAAPNACQYPALDSPRSMISSSSAPLPPALIPSSMPIQISPASHLFPSHVSFSIHAPPPPTGSVSFATHLTPHLRHLASCPNKPGKPQLRDFFHPLRTTRAPRVWERGCWRFEIPGPREEADAAWNGKTREKFWKFLGEFVRSGRAGWGVWAEQVGAVDAEGLGDKGGAGATDGPAANRKVAGSRDGERARDVVRVWCWGEVVTEVWTMLFLGSARKIKGLGLEWVDAGGDVVVKMD